jgi:protease-4
MAVITIGGLAAVTLFLIASTLWHPFSRNNAPGRLGARDMAEITLEDNGSKDKVAVLDISGVISGDAAGFGRAGLVGEVRDQLQRMADDEAVKAVILRVDSPGGEVLASDEIYAALRQFQTNNDVPVVACMGSLAASGGYYVSAPCRWIVAHPLTLTGSIGVIFHGYNYRGLMDKVGVRPEVVKSGKLKDMFSGELRAEDESPEEKIILKDLVTESFNRFKQVIREGRGWAAQQNAAEQVTGGRPLSEQWEEYADGRILSGNQALSLGLVDELGDFETAYHRACSLAGVEGANLVAYEMPPRFGDFLHLLGSSRSERISVNLEGLNPVTRLPQGRLYFLSPLHLR